MLLYEAARVRGAGCWSAVAVGMGREQTDGGAEGARVGGLRGAGSTVCGPVREFDFVICVGRIWVGVEMSRVRATRWTFSRRE